MHASDIAFSLTCSTHLFPVVKYVDRRLSIFMQFPLGLQRIHYNMDYTKILQIADLRIQMTVARQTVTRELR